MRKTRKFLPSNVSSTVLQILQKLELNFQNLQSHHFGLEKENEAINLLCDYSFDKAEEKS